MWEGSLASAAPAELGVHEWATSVIAGLPRDCSPATRERNLEVIANLGSPANAAALLRDVASSPSLLAEVAGRSYRHTNHFDKIVLIDTGAKLGYRLTLHLWSPPYDEAELVDEQIHDHRFSFWSKILVGTMEFQDYVRDPSGVLHNEFQYIPEKLGVATVGNFYLDVGESPLLEVGRSGGPAGKHYHLPYSQIHRVVLPTQELTCTMVLRGPRQKNYASVFSTSRKYDPSGNSMFTPGALAERLARIVTGLEETAR